MPSLSWAESISAFEELEETVKPVSLTWAEQIFVFEELECLKPKPVILPRTLVAYLPTLVTVFPPMIFPAPKLKKRKPKPLAPIVVALQTLSLAVDKTEGYRGDVFTFSGQLVKSGTRKGYTVTLFKDSFSVGSGLTDARGNYTVPWTSDAVGSYTFHSETAV